jgi:predicted nucleic acid-binding protein
VSLTILLDTGPLGLVTNPKPSPQSLACAQWLQTVIQKHCRIVIPEIADYELRRELIRANKQRGLSRLDTLAQSLEYLPLTTAAMRQAAILWAQARQQGQPTAGDATIDGDVILAAEALTIGVSNCLIATTNVGHLSRYCPAELWQDIQIL